MSKTDKGQGRRRKHPEQPVEPDPAHADLPGGDSDQEPPVVLIVEDEEPIAEALAYLVEDCGYVALRAAHGREALYIARLKHPRLVITDLMLPIMNGRELIAALRADADKDGMKAPPIILTTAGGLAYAQNTGADIVLTKPFDATEIEDLLARFLGSPRDAK